MSDVDVDNGPLVAVGSANPGKARAVGKALARVWPGVRVEACAVDSGVSAMRTMRAHTF